MSALPTHRSVAPGDPWWKGAVVYQIYPKSFLDTNGDGIGDLRGIITKLDYLAFLGVDALWLSPVNVSPQEDNGYDIQNYEDIDPLFGTLADYDELIAGAHARGIRIVMDLVFNHSSDQHPWFLESRSRTDSPKRDWYYWRPAREGHTPGSPGAEPNNWPSMFSGPTWTFDDATGEYYLHLFSSHQPDLNWENPAVREAIYAMVNRWLDRGVDGFRLDAINFLSKAPGLPDGYQGADDPYDFALPLYTDGPRMHEWMHEFHQRCLDGRQTITVGEMGGTTVDEAVLYTDPARAELDMVFAFDHVIFDRGDLMDSGQLLPHWPMAGLKETLAFWQTGLADTGWNSLYWDNHDQPRVVSRFGNDTTWRVESAKLLAAILHLQRGTPFIFQGEEFGMTNHHWTSLDEFQDIRAVSSIARARQLPNLNEANFIQNLGRFTRDNGRTPVQWTAGPNAGFTTGQPWMPINANADTVNAEAALADEGSVLHFYRRLIELRHTMPIIVDGRFEMLLPEHEALFAFTRSLDHHQLLVVGNMADTETDASPLQAWFAQPCLLGNYPEPMTATMRPWEVRVYLREEPDHA